MDALTRHHYNSIASGTAKESKQGLQTVRAITVEMDNKVFLIPSWWNGKEVDMETAIQNALKSGETYPHRDIAPGQDPRKLEDELVNLYTQKIKPTWDVRANGDPEVAKDILASKR